MSASSLITKAPRLILNSYTCHPSANIIIIIIRLFFFPLVAREQVPAAVPSYVAQTADTFSPAEQTGGCSTIPAEYGSLSVDF